MSPTSVAHPPHDVPAFVHAFTAPTSARLFSTMRRRMVPLDTLLHEQMVASSGNASMPIAGPDPSIRGRINCSGWGGTGIRLSII